MLSLIGIGLADEKDITVNGLEAVRAADRVFLEGYTSVLQVPAERLSAFYGKDVEVLGRAAVEQDAERILDAAASGDAAFLVVGDVFAATTHTDLFLRARARGIPVRVLPNASVLNAIGLTGLDLYRFGRTVTLVFPEKSYAPESFFDAIAENRARGLHTLCLLDIKAEEERFMTVPEAVELLLSIERRRGAGVLFADTHTVGCARLASETQRIVYAPLAQLRALEWGGPPQCLAIPGTLHVVEEEMLAQWKA